MGFSQSIGSTTSFLAEP